MGLYLANHSLLVHLGGKLYELNVGAPMKAAIDRLLSSDDLVLKDLNGIYLIPADGKGSEDIAGANGIPANTLISADNFIFTDKNNVCLTYRESD